MNVPLERKHEIGFVRELADLLRDRLPGMQETIMDGQMPLWTVEVYRRGSRQYDFQVRKFSEQTKDYEFVWGLTMDRELAETAGYKTAMRERYGRDV